MGYIPDRHGESKFEAELRSSCKIIGCDYRKIKDSVYRKRRVVSVITSGDGIQQKNTFIDQPKDFDGLLYTPNKTWSIECKYNNHGITQHQKDAHLEINAINDSHRFLRKIVKDDVNQPGTLVILYRVEQIIDGIKTVIQEFDKSIDKLTKWIKEQI